MRAAPNVRRAGTRLGVLAGLIGIACCVVPTVLAFVGVSSAAAAIALAKHLYKAWGWTFKLSALAFAGAALWLQMRRARSCPVERRPDLGRLAFWLVGTALATYTVLYLLTTFLGRLAG